MRTFFHAQFRLHLIFDQQNELINASVSFASFSNYSVPLSSCMFQEEIHNIDYFLNFLDALSFLTI